MQISSPPALLFIEDHPAITEYTCAALERIAPPLRILTAKTGAEGLVLARANAPAVVVLDLSLPDGDGLDLISELRAGPQSPAIIIFTGRSDDATLLRLSAVDVAGLLWKGSDTGAEIVTAVKKALAGEQHVSSHFSAAWQQLRADPASFTKRLSPAELRLLPDIGRGWDNATVGRANRLATTTVKNHRQHILRKLKLPGSAALVAWLAEHGFTVFPKRRPPAR